MTDPQQDLFTNIPIEPLLEIVKHLNAHTLRSLLLACKRLRAYATRFILKLSDYSDSSPLFFGGIPGIESVTVNPPASFTADHFKGCHIKLVELCPVGLYVALNMDKELLSDPLCFIHALGGSDMVACTTLLLDPKRRCFQNQRHPHGNLVHGVDDLNVSSSRYMYTHLERPMRAYFFGFPHIYYPLQLYAEKVWYSRVLKNSPGIVFNKVPQSDKIISSRLTFLAITGTSLVENICLPLLRRLSVEFYQTSDDTVPEIRNIHAPYLLVFRVHFSGKMPTLSQIDVCSFQWPSKRTFELVNTNATSPTFFREDSTTEYTDYQDMDLGFFHHLDAVSLTGVPDFVLNAVHQVQYLYELHWHHSVAYTHRSMPVRAEKLTLRSLRSLVIKSGAPNFTPPDFATPNVRNLIVSLTGFNPNLRDLIPKAARGSHLCILHVVSIPSDKRLIGHPQAHITLSKEDMGAIQFTVRVEDRNPEVTIQGCFFGDNNSLVNTGLDPWFASIVRPPGLKDDVYCRPFWRTVNLVCVRPLGDTASDTLNLQFLKDTNLPIIMLVVRQLFNEKDGPWRKLAFVVPTTSVKDGVVDGRAFEEVDARCVIRRRIPQQVFRQ